MTDTQAPATAEPPLTMGKKDRGTAGTWRMWLLCALFLICAGFLRAVGQGNPLLLSRPLSDFPRIVGPWQAGPDEILPENVVRVLNVDDYVSRSYVGPGSTVHFYASYFSTTWGGKTYHSPRNCMPGSGWDVADLQVVPVTFTNPHPRTIKVSRMLMQKGAEHQIVLYWYQGRGRIMPTEYSERLYRVLDSLIHRRTDGAFVRIIVPVMNHQVDAAMSRATDFARVVVPILNTFLPE